MASTFEPYPAGLEIALAAPEMQRALYVKAVRVREFAMYFSPVRTGRYKYGAILLHNGNDPTGHRRRKAKGNFERLPEGAEGGFRIIVGVRKGRAYARVVNVTPYAVFLEFGTRYMYRHRILGKAADAVKL